MRPFHNLYKIKAGALQYAIFIAVLIALLLAAFIALIHTQQMFELQGRLQIKCVQNVNLEFDNTYQNKKNWGIFDLLTVKSTIKNQSFEKTILMGGFKQEKPALYLKDNNRPLVLVGTAKIEGSVYLPKQGVKPGVIGGVLYKGDKLIDGVMHQSNNILKKPVNIDELAQVYNDDDFYLDEIESVEINPFKLPTKVYHQNAPIDLEKVILKGNMIVSSDSIIRVFPSAKLQNVILKAPKIEIMPYVEGNFQAIASKNINVASNCKLHYPTALLLVDKQSNNSQINIASNTIVKGIVGYFSDNKPNYKTQIFLDNNATIMGEVFCDSNFELRGTVKGSVYTNAFIVNNLGSVFQNHVYDGKILNAGLPKQYVGLQFDKNKIKEMLVLE